MPTPRNQQICLSETPYNHCIARCARRIFLSDFDTTTDKDYNHRKQWIAERIALMAIVFAIEICAYSILDNHFHGILKINASIANAWTVEEVVKRWQQLFTIPVLVERYLSGDCPSSSEQDKAQKAITMFQKRLMDISWFMRCLNEHNDRKVKAEDKCTGRFWEGRCKSQALLNEQALLACMDYVNLNPIRADLCDTLENFDYTSVKQRIEQIKSKPCITKLAQFIAGGCDR